MVHSYAGSTYEIRGHGTGGYTESMQQGLEYLASPVDVIDLLLFEKTDDALLRFRRGHMVEPVGLRFDILRSDNLNLVAALDRCKIDSILWLIFAPMALLPILV